MRPWNPDQRLDAKQVVRWIFERRGERVSTPTVYRWMLKGVDGIRLPASRVGGKNWKVQPQDLEEFLKACSVRGNAMHASPPVQVQKSRLSPAGVSAARCQQIRAVSEQLRQKLSPRK